MVDIARPESVIRKKKIRKIMMGVSALVVIIVISVAVSKIKPAAPSVDRATVWIDTVKRGEMLRQVRGSGTLVPIGGCDHVRPVKHRAAGRP
jgi:HlyD family secretion protein